LELIDVGELFVQTVAHLLFKLHVSVGLLQLDVSLVVENLLLKFLEIESQLLDIGRVISDLVRNNSFEVIVAD
jgi:hypothetical protein